MRITFTSVHRIWDAFLAASAQDSSWSVCCGRAGAPASPHAPSAHGSCIPAFADSSVAFSWHRFVVNVVHILFRFSELVHHIALLEPITAKLILQSVSDAEFFACYGNLFFGLPSMCVTDPMCNKRFSLRALLVTTLKSHMCLQQSGCVLWLVCLLRFLWFGFQ